jgi:site-specific DNA recombinase
MFAEYAHGTSLARIRKQLDDMGVSTPSAYLHAKGWPTPRRHVSQRWALSTLDRMLSDPAYVGRHSAYRAQQFKQEVEEDGYRVLVKWREQRASDNPERIYYDEDVCPALVDEETWQQVQARRQRNKLEAARNMDREKAGLLRAGFVVCGYCGHRMLTTQQIAERRVFRRYTCRTHLYFAKGLRADDCPIGAFVSIHQEPLDGAVWVHITRILTDPSLLQDTYDQLMHRERVNEELHADRLAAIVESLEKAEKRRRRAERYALEAEDEEEADHYNQEAKTALKEVRRLEAEHAQLAQQHATRNDQKRLFTDLIARKNETAAQLLQMTYEERRQLLYELGVQVRVYRKEHDPWWKITADVARIVAHFTTLPGYDRRKAMNKSHGESHAVLATNKDSHSDSNNQNTGKPCSRIASGPLPASTECSRTPLATT